MSFIIVNLKTFIQTFQFSTISSNRLLRDKEHQGNMIISPY